jgi:hypothetical protein
VLRLERLGGAMRDGPAAGLKLIDIARTINVL